MEQQHKYDTAISDFTAQLYHKGYRGKFTLHYPHGQAPRMTGALTECLQKMVEGFEKTEYAKPFFELETYADNGHDKHCNFKVRLDEVKGFLVNEMMINDSVTRQHKQYRFVSNHQIPGSVAVQGLFPKPKPWDHIRKGKFRP